MRPARATSADDDIRRLAALVLALTGRVEKLERELERLRNARFADELIPQRWKKL